MFSNNKGMLSVSSRERSYTTNWSLCKCSVRAGSNIQLYFTFPLVTWTTALIQIQALSGKWKASHRKELKVPDRPKKKKKRKRTETELGVALTHADLLEFQCTCNKEHLHQGLKQSLPNTPPPIC